MAIAALIAWILTALVGLTVLVQWWRRRGGKFPLLIVLTHIATALLGLYFWFGFVYGHGARWAWLTFGLMILNNALGDAILTKRFRLLSGVGGRWWQDYWAAIKSLFNGTRPRFATIHAALAGVTAVLITIACVQTLF